MDPVLVVENIEKWRNVVFLPGLKAMGYVVQSANTMEEAVEQIRQTEFAAVILNPNLLIEKDFLGELVLAAVVRHSPLTPCILVSGNPFLTKAKTGRYEYQIYALLYKGHDPTFFDLSALFEVLKSAIEDRAGVRKLLSILDSHLSDVECDLLQRALIQHYRNPGFGPPSGYTDNTKKQKLGYMIAVLVNLGPQTIHTLCDMVRRLRPQDTVLHQNLDSICPPSSHPLPPVLPETESYVDFELYIGPDGYVRASSDEGERTVQIPLEISDEVSQVASQIEADGVDESTLKHFGSQLYALLFSPEIDKHFNQTQAVARDRERQVRIRLIIQSDSLARLPWEFIYREEEGCYLATNPKTVLSHYIDLGLPPGRTRRRNGPLHLLAIISSPQDLPDLDIDRWERIIAKALDVPIREGQITLKTIKHATFEEIRNALFAHAPDIVQFIGHGIYQQGKGHLALVDGASEKAWLVDDGQFASIFASASNQLGLVCLTACESAKSDSPKSFLGLAPKMVQKGVPAVVAMRYAVLVSTAEIFMDNFYTALAAHKPVDWAVQWARNALSIQVGLDSREFATPVLFMRARDGEIF